MQEKVERCKLSEWEEVLPDGSTKPVGNLTADELSSCKYYLKGTPETKSTPQIVQGYLWPSIEFLLVIWSLFAGLQWLIRGALT